MPALTWNAATPSGSRGIPPVDTCGLRMRAAVIVGLPEPVMISATRPTLFLRNAVGMEASAAGDAAFR